MPPGEVTELKAGETVGIIAGQGMLPVSVAQGLMAAGHRVVVAALAGQAEESLLAQQSHVLQRVGLIRINQWIRLFRRQGVRQAIMVGRVAKERIYDRWYFLRYVPDWRTIRVWFVRLRHDKRSDRLLRAVADELSDGGITLIDVRPYIGELLATDGLMNRARPSAEVLADIAFAWPLLQQMNALLVGQSLACKDREIIAVEAMEGTDRMIERAGVLCRRGGWVLCKASNPNQDIRFDVPTVGEKTLHNLKQAGAAALVVQAGRTIMLEKPKMLALADELGISVIGKGE
ncbi:MAG: UDP-2,3-diacylglucosamine diphosphatase LpxI [Phycisphaerales bacterium]|nr:UDP-2,3-diacylglucosamine diphosphatase LpxI [Phycisphaerales bacterium]